MLPERTDFQGADGQTLSARRDLPKGEVRAYALFAHCFTCGKDVFAASRIAQALTEHDIAVGIRLYRFGRQQSRACARPCS
jgi:putative redox protein